MKRKTFLASVHRLTAGRAGLAANRLLLIFLAIGAYQAAQAQPDAGVLLQQIEKGAAPSRMPGVERPKTSPEPEELRPAAGISVTVKAFRFSGNRLLDDQALAAVVAPWVGRTLALNELRKAATAVAEAYRARGWIVRAYLPKQDVTEGIVTIHVVEAVFGGARYEGEPLTRINSARVVEIIEHQQPRGQPLSGAALDRGLLLADDLPGVLVSGILLPGPAEGETSIALKLLDESFVTGTVTVDNAGARSIGAERISASLNLNSPLGVGDLASANLIHSEGSDYARLAYSLPVGLDGLRVGVNGSSLSYRLISPEYAALRANGNSTSAGLELSYPLLRSRPANLYFLGNADHKGFDNNASGVTSSRYNVDSLSLGLYGNLIDNLGGGGANSASFIYSGGRVDLTNNPNPRNDGSGGDFAKLRYSLARQQIITNDLSLYLSWNGQRAGSNLDSSERFYLGGSTGVRAYPASEGGGAEGDLWTLELRQRLNTSLVLAAFYDYGNIKQYRNNVDAAGNSLTGRAPNSYALAGYGLALSWVGPKGIVIKATWARRDGSNPNPTITGRDQDGSLFQDRLWLSADWLF